MCLENPEIRGKSKKLRHLTAKTTKAKRPVNFLCLRFPRTMASASLPNLMWACTGLPRAVQQG